MLTLLYIFIGLFGIFIGVLLYSAYKLGKIIKDLDENY